MYAFELNFFRQKIFDPKKRPTKKVCLKTKLSNIFLGESICWQTKLMRKKKLQTKLCPFLGETKMGKGGGYGGARDTRGVIGCQGCDRVQRE